MFIDTVSETVFLFWYFVRKFLILSLAWNSDQCVAGCIFWEGRLSVGLLPIIGREDEVVLLLDMLQRHLHGKCKKLQKRRHIDWLTWDMITALVSR